jgi:outer membrane protein
MKFNKIGLAVLMASVMGAAQAGEAGDWVFKVGVHQVAPKSNNGTLADGALAVKVGKSVEPTVSLEYLITPNWGVQVLGAVPFTHEVKLNGFKSADVTHLPPTVTAEYHFLPDSQFSPFVGAGFNYTRFFNVKEKGPIANTQLNLGDSWGVALHGGFDVHFADRWLVSADLRWMNIQSTARLNGAKLGTVKIDPLVYGVSVGYRF